LALTGLVRADGRIASRGLAYFTGREFILSGKDGKPGEGDLRVAIRLVDWLVAHGRVDAPREVTLVGFGPVWVEPDSRNSLKARVLWNRFGAKRHILGVGNILFTVNAQRDFRIRGLEMTSP
jgi:hypothetical protein